MKACTATILLLISTSALRALQPEDGIYLRSLDDSAPSVMGQDGHKLFLGARQNLKIRKSGLFSQNNANTRFSLDVSVPYDERIGPSSYILIVAGTAYRQTSGGSSQKQVSSLYFHISGEENAKRISEYVKTPVLYRRHPHHALLVSFIPSSQDFSVGDEVTATLQIANVGTNTFAFMKGGRNRAARDNQYVFSARFGGKQVEDIGTSYHHGGLAAKRVLKPGDIFEDSISLSHWFEFGEVGMYEIYGSYYLGFVDPDDDSFRTVWEDYVSDVFHVSIKK
jgi:hypothetical protein